MSWWLWGLIVLLGVVAVLGFAWSLLVIAALSELRRVTGLAVGLDQEDRDG